MSPRGTHIATAALRCSAHRRSNVPQLLLQSVWRPDRGPIRKVVTHPVFFESAGSEPVLSKGSDSHVGIAVQFKSGQGMNRTSGRFAEKLGALAANGLEIGHQLGDEFKNCRLSWRLIEGKAGSAPEEY